MKKIKLIRLTYKGTELMYTGWPNLYSFKKSWLPLRLVAVGGSLGWWVDKGIFISVRQLKKLLKNEGTPTNRNR